MFFNKVRDVKSPLYGTDQAAGIDFFVPNDAKRISLGPGEAAFIPSGIRTILPKGKALVAFNKSGVALKKKLLAGACVVDSDYRGEMHLHVINCGNTHQLIEPGDKLIQFVYMDTPQVNKSEVSDEEFELLSKLMDADNKRGTGGFGSTGTK
jgi:dUTP pyrophosphatase